MKKLLSILLCVLCLNAFSQQPRPVGLPSPFSTNWYRVGFIQGDSGVINAVRDTSLRARFAGTMVFWQHGGVDSNLWINDGNKWFHYLKNGQDVINALGYTPLANITGYIQQGNNVTITGLGTLGSPYIINASGGGGSGNFNSFAFTDGNGIIGTVTGSTGPNVSLALSTGLNGIINANGTGFGTVTIGAGLNYSGGVLSATGNTSLNGPIAGNGSAFVTYNIGAGLSFSGNTLTNTINNTNQLTNGAGFITNITGLVTQGTNVTITGSGTSGSPYVINSSGGSGSVTGAGNLSPLFTTGLSAGTITFTASNAAAFTVYGNFTGSSAAPTFGKPQLTSAMFANQGTSTTVLIGNGAGNPSFGLVNLSSMVSNTLPVGNGGTGLTSYTTGDMLYASSSSTLAALSDVATLNVMLSGGVGVAPSWGKLALGAMANITASTLIGNPNGTSGAPQVIPLGFGLKFDVLGKLAVDTTAFKDTIYLRNLGTVGDSLAYALPGGTLGIRRLNFSTGFTTTHNSDSSLTLTVSGGGGGGLTVQRVTSGSSGTVTGSNYVYLLDPGSTLSTYTATLPASPTDAQIVIFLFGGTLPSGVVVTSMTVSPNSGQGIIDNTPVTAVSVTSDNSIEYRWIAANSKWYRFKP